MKAKSQRILFTEGPYGMSEVPRHVQRIYEAASLAARQAPPDMHRIRVRLMHELRNEIWGRGYRMSDAEFERLQNFAESVLLHLSTGGIFKPLTHEMVKDLREPPVLQ